MKNARIKIGCTPARKIPVKPDVEIPIIFFSWKISSTVARFFLENFVERRRIRTGFTQSVIPFANNTSASVLHKMTSATGIDFGASDPTEYPLPDDIPREWFNM